MGSCHAIWMTSRHVSLAGLRSGTAARRRIEHLASALSNQWTGDAEAQEYIQFQWQQWIMMADVVSRRARWLFYLARWLVVVGATIVPTLVVVGGQAHGTVAAVTQTAAVVLSLLVAAAAGALQVTQMGHRWHLLHKLRFQLEHTAVQLLLRRGEYEIGNSGECFARFVDQIQGIMVNYEEAYSARIVRLGESGGSYE